MMQWMDDGAQIEELETEEDDGYPHEMLLDDQPFLPRSRPRATGNGRRGQSSRNAHHNEYADETESVVDGVDYDLYDDADSTVAYAVQLAMRDKEELLVDKALERIRRAQMLGRKNVRLSQRELDALERKRLRSSTGTGGSKDAGRKKNAAQVAPVEEKGKGKKSSPTNSKSKGRPSIAHAPPEPSHFPDEAYGSWGRATGSTVGIPLTAGARPSSSSSQRPRTPSSHSLRPQLPNTPPRPPYPQQYLPERFAPMPDARSPSSARNRSFSRPLPDDPQWAPPLPPQSYVDPSAINQTVYPPTIPVEFPYGLSGRRGAAELSPYRTRMRPYADERYSSSAFNSYSSQRAPVGTPMESSSEKEDDEDETDEDSDDDVQIVKVVERKAPVVQQPGASGGRNVRQRASRR